VLHEKHTVAWLQLLLKCNTVLLMQLLHNCNTVAQMQHSDFPKSWWAVSENQKSLVSEIQKSWW
jgi:hypothetical protein